jgi:hypothetical protein
MWAGLKIKGGLGIHDLRDKTKPLLKNVFSSFSPKIEFGKRSYK